eukprot:g3088.t1
MDKDVGIRARTHYHDFRAYPNTFTGLELVRWLMNHDIVIDSDGATLIGTQLMKIGHIVAIAGRANGANMFSGNRGALYNFASVGSGRLRHRRGSRLSKADSRIFSKRRWQGFLGSKSKPKTHRKRSLKEQVRRMSLLFPARSKTNSKKQPKRALRQDQALPAPQQPKVNKELEGYAKGKTALQQAVDQGFDYREVIVPTYMPIFTTSEGGVLRNPIDEKKAAAPTTYHFHYNTNIVRHSERRNAARIEVPATNIEKQGQCLFYMIGETERVRAEFNPKRAPMTRQNTNVYHDSTAERQARAALLHQRAIDALQ